ncbi:pilus assembly protein [Desulfomicrobium baculatum]|nr:PilC/PilY family type IV pilus protein [Desulfomicrobium baculatum]
MKSSRVPLLIFLFILYFASIALAAQSITAEQFSCNNYAHIPPFLSDAVKPSTTLIVDSSGSMNEHAYQEEAVYWGNDNTRAYTGYNASNEYYGYFEPSANYTYDETADYFKPDTSGKWNGNFMNWVSMHRTDIVRKVLTGGAYNNATNTYLVSKTDGGNSRGMYHVFNATGKNVTPYSEPLGFKQTASDNYITLYKATPPNTTSKIWSIGSEVGKFQLKIYSEKKYGLLHRFGYRMRLALFRYDDDVTKKDISGYEDGGEILNYMTSDSTEIDDIINNIDEIAVNSWTPLAETLYTACGYIRQDNNLSNEIGPRYETDAYNVQSGDSYPSPYYFADIGDEIWCSNQNVILITDGESTQDQNLPEFIKDGFDGANNDNVTYPNEGSAFLDNVAYWAHTTDMRDDLEGNQTVDLYTIFAFGSGSQLLKEAAKWGGFKDNDGNGEPTNSTEYDTSPKDGIPDNYFEAATGAELENALITAFSSILNRVSSGSAASVVSTSRKGAGLLYQAVFWPQRDKTTWTGDVYAYWLDNDGIMHEDNGTSEHVLDPGDAKVTIWYDESDKESKACSGGEVVNGTCTGEEKKLSSVKHVWSASRWLNKMSDSEALIQRSNYNSTSGEDKSLRYIFTWNDDGDGIIDYDNEVVDFIPGNVNSTLCPASVVNWIRGEDNTALRSREINVDRNFDGEPETPETWRMGDIINSSPTVVSAPAENYDLYWNDSTYTEFYKQYKNRRVMVYFGANDGMLHAVNSGFYSEKTGGYYTNIESNGTLSTNGGFELGTEMWAYVPYNLLPHLSCLTNPNYQHQYYVDLKPRVFDAKVFYPDKDHPEGWGTILVCGFNFGGDGQQNLAVGTNYFGSSFVMFDVTNPEVPPVLLGELTFDGTYTLGYSVNQPTLVAVNGTDGERYWYMLFGTGPLETDGQSNQKAQVIVIPMAAIIDAEKGPNIPTSFSLRMDASIAKPSSSDKGILSLSDSDSAMGTGFVSVDYDFDFFIDMMYYGTVVTPNKGDFTGGVHRLKVEAEPDPSKWERKEMTDTGGPMTGAPNVGFKDKNVWVYFGTGKFWDTLDKTDLRTQWMYGIMEPKKTDSSAYNFSTIPPGNLFDVTGIQVLNDGSGLLECDDSLGDCPPSDVTTVEELADYIRDTPNIDGWRRAMNNSTGERVVGQPTLFGGLTNFTTFTPSSDYCTAEGTSKLYALYYRTGTAWKENVFGDGGGKYVPFIVDLGQGMGVSPSLHLGSEEGVRAFVQTSTGSIIEIHQPNLPIPNVKSGRGGWHTLEVD